VSTDPPTTLYHYTCNHGLPGIAADQLVLPNIHPWLGYGLAWLTDLDVPDRLGLGLTSVTLCCDRTAHRVEVDSTADVMHWPKWAHEQRVPWLTRLTLEGAGSALPMHWWVSTTPVPVRAIVTRIADTVTA
jgi:hypothetical protein